MPTEIPSPRQRAEQFVARTKNKVAISNPQFVDLLADAFEDATRDAPRWMGRKGGTKNRDLRGHEHYVAIGKKGGAQVKAAFEALRAAQSK